MSYPQGDHQAPSPGAGQRPSFDRPSLFAGMEDDEAPEDTRRVRILSTLESTRQASRPGRTKGGRRTRKSKGRSWLQSALWGVMGVGVLALMAAFVMVIQDTRPAVAHAPSPSPSIKPHALAKPEDNTARLGNGAEAGPAVIETTAVAKAQAAPAPAAAATASSAPPAPSGHNPLAAVDTQVASASPSLAKAGSHADRDKTTAAASPTTKAGPAASDKADKTDKSTGKPARQATKGQDEDVALLEAMFAHTGRKAAPKPAERKN